MNNPAKALGWLLSLWFVGALQTAAAALLLDPVLVTGTGGGGTYNFGYSITVGASNLTFASIGFYDKLGDGLVASHDVGVWNGSGTLIASATIPVGTAGTFISDDDSGSYESGSGYRYVDLATPVTLLSGQTYVIGGVMGNETYMMYGSATITGATITSPALYATGGSLTEPTLTGGGAFLEVNLSTTSVSAVPEPSICSLAMGLAGLGVISWNRRLGRRPL